MTLSKSQIIFFSILVAIGIGLFFLLKTIFIGKWTSNDDLVKQILASKDSVIASKNENIALHERLIEEKDKSVEALLSRDSILSVHYNEGEITYKKLNETIKKIPDRITMLRNNPDSLARAFADF